MYKQFNHLVLLAALALAGCQMTGQEGESCDDHLDCSGHLLCTAGTCVEPAEDQRQRPGPFAYDPRTEGPKAGETPEYTPAVMAVRATFGEGVPARPEIREVPHGRGVAVLVGGEAAYLIQRGKVHALNEAARRWSPDAPDPPRYVDPDRVLRALGLQEVPES